MNTNDSQSEVFLGVESSVTGKCWRQRPADERLGLGLAQRFDLPEIIGRLLAGRGITEDNAEDFLDPRLASSLPDPAHLLGMEDAVDRIALAVEKGQAICVFGDYDVDGATSSALLSRFFRALGMDIRVYIPDRIKEGYGPNQAALDMLRSDGAELLITVDCGTNAFEPLARAAGQGLDVIVLDHHIAEAHLPDAVAVINPNRIDDDSPHKQWAAVGVTFLLIVAVNRALRDGGFYAKDNSPAEPNLMQWLDLVALGTVADVVSLTGVNRAFVTQGLKVLARRANTGLAALSDAAGIDETPGAYHLGFILGPRINAGGRVGESALGARLLASDDAIEATRIATQLDQYNRERRNIEAAVLAQALESTPEAGQTRGGVFAMGQGWHPGVIGIVASRLVERFDQPAFVISLGEDGTGVASARSMPGIDLGAMVSEARQKGLLLAGGGHAMAAGFTVGLEHLKELRKFLNERIAACMEEASLAPVLKLDGVLTTAAANSIELVETIQRLAPFGSGNAEPRFAFSGVRIAHSDVVGADHVRCRLASSGSGQLSAISFRSAEGPLGRALLKHNDLPLHLAGRARLNHWQGKTNVQILIDDAAPSR